MAISEMERDNTWKTQVQFISGSTYVDPSGNLAYLTVYDPSDTALAGYDDVSGSRVSLGTYKYYVRVSSNNDLGLYRCKWRGDFNYGNPWNFKQKLENEIVLIKKVIQS